MIYLDHGATSMEKPIAVLRAMEQAVRSCGNPGRGGHKAAMAGAETVFRCRESAGQMFGCRPERVVFTANCTQGLNMAIHSLAQWGSRVVVSGFEHNAVMRPLRQLGAKVTVAGRRLFDSADTLQCFEDALKRGADGAVFTHVSNVFGYILPVGELAALCRRYGVPFAVDAAQSAGMLPLRLDELGADFIAMPGHKGLLGPMGTGILLCNGQLKPLLSGGTGSYSRSYDMPEELPDRGEAGTVNVPGIAGLAAGIRYVQKVGVETIGRRQRQAAQSLVAGLQQAGYTVFCGDRQSGTVSFLPRRDAEQTAADLARRGIALRAGLHCAPLAHESAGTLESGTLRASFGHDAASWQAQRLLEALKVVDVM